MTAAAVDTWTPEVAEEIAARAGISLDERHWHAITLCRELFALEGTMPDAERVGAPPELQTLLPRICGHAPLERSNS